MAVPLPRTIARFLSRISPIIFQATRHTARTSVSLWSHRACVCLQPSRFVFTTGSRCGTTGIKGVAEEGSARYQDRPWAYLESEEYAERYGSTPVWSGYRRNHKGGIPPQKTRRTCIRGEKICGNPCPICRDPNIIIHYQNVKLLQQFIHPHFGEVYDHTRTGVCMKQQKRLKQAIEEAKNHGLLPFQVPFVDYSAEDYTNSHDAVGCTPPRPSVTPDDPWYLWYQAQADEREVAKVKKIYKAYLK